MTAPLRGLGGTASAASILAHLHVDVAAFVRSGAPPAYLASVLACVAAYRTLQSSAHATSLLACLSANT